MTAESGRASKPEERECALLITHLLAEKQKAVAKEVTRARLSELTMQRLFRRQRITAEFLAEVQEWLFPIGWIVFFTGSTYAVVKVKVIGGWGRISSNRIGKDLDRVARGQFKFEKLEKLLLPPVSDAAGPDAQEEE